MLQPKKWSWGNDGQHSNPYPKPMKSTVPLMSDVEIRIYRQALAQKAAPASIHEGQTGHDEGSDGWDKVQRVIRPLSSAIWGRCKFYTYIYLQGPLVWY